MYYMKELKSQLLGYVKLFYIIFVVKFFFIVTLLHS